MENNDLKFEQWRAAVRLSADNLRKENPGTCFETLKAYTDMGDYNHNCVVSVSMHILTENVTKIKTPKTWWEAFKEQNYPEFLLKKYPVKYDSVCIKALYPDATFKDQRIVWKRQTVVE